MNWRLVTKGKKQPLRFCFLAFESHALSALKETFRGGHDDFSSTWALSLSTNTLAF